jgi:hypothetical protein
VSSSADVPDNVAAAAPAAEPPGRRPAKLLNTGIILGAATAALTYGIVGAGLGPSAPLVLLTFGGVALAVFGLALFRVIEPLVRPASAAARAAETRASARLRELEREKGLVLKAIREIEHDYHMRKISEVDYKELTHRYRTRALRLIREIDAGDDFRGLIEQELKTRLAALAASPEPKSEAKSSGTGV